MGKPTFFRALAKDPTANTIVIAAASLVPLVGMVGGAVDASRYYMTTTRLQAACDAGALAARRAMADDTFDPAVHGDIGDRFFEQNYSDGMFGMENLTNAYTSNGDGEVKGTASGKLPNTLMQIFGFEDFDVSVSCSADINISNSDIMFVLDVTGSMNCAPDNPGGGNCGNTEDTGSKIEGMRAAVMSFYDTVEASTSPNAQVRYGVVPYASNVNVGGALRDEWMARNHTFQSRVANFRVDQTDWVQIAANIIEVRETSPGSTSYRESEEANSVTAAECAALRPADDIMFDDELGPYGQISQTIDGNIRTTRYDDQNERVLRREGFADFNENGNSGSGKCTYGYDIFPGTGAAIWDLVEEFTETVVFDNYTYRPIDTAAPPANQHGQPGWEDVDLTTLYDDNVIQMPVGTNGAMVDVTWDGCIEEADTLNTADFDSNTDDFNDLDLNLVPDADDEFWKPILPTATWRRTDNGNNTQGWLTQTWNEGRPGYSCPAAAIQLTDISRTDLETYVDSLQGRSNTYHDIGMIWGARFIAPNGIFNSQNATAPNGDAIARHIVFMTDGLLAPNVEVYGTYGIEWWDRRITTDGGWTQARDRHAERFQIACQKARNENITVWVVAFGTTLTDNLRDCASPGRAFQASDTATLTTRFKEIAQQIAALRLTT